MGETSPTSATTAAEPTQPELDLAAELYVAARDDSQVEALTRIERAIAETRAAAYAAGLAENHDDAFDAGFREGQRAVEQGHRGPWS